MSRATTLRNSTEGRTIAVVGDVYRFLSTAADTDGGYAMWEAFVTPGGGPPPHIHRREEESFYILEGEITVRHGENSTVATAGMFVNIPVGTPHSFKNESDRPAKLLITIAPAGLEEMFFEIGTPVDAGSTIAPPPSKEEIEKLIRIAPDYGIELLLPKN